MSTNRKIVITGGPGTGKTSIINFLKENGHQCLLEISRQVTLEAQAQGIEQLFLTDPLLFSNKLLEGRINQYKESEVLSGTIFFDRGIPDIVAYMNYAGDHYPPYYKEACLNHCYDHVFLLPPWETIYTSDNERYENFEQATAIHHHLKKTYLDYGYEFLEVPQGSISERANFVLNNLQ